MPKKNNSYKEIYRPNQFTRLRYRFVPDHLFGEFLSKPWIDTCIPAILLGLVLIVFYLSVPEFFSASSIESLGRVTGEFAYLAIGQAVVMIGGGIDLSVGSIFGLCNLIALILVFKLKVHVTLALILTVALGASIGAVNGILIGYFKLRAFLTTLVMLIIVRAAVEYLGPLYSLGLVTGEPVQGAELFEFLADGKIFGIASSLSIALIFAVIMHIVLTRMRLGWHILAVGGSRRSAFNASIDVRKVVFITYLISGSLAGVAAFFYAARLNSTGLSTGIGIELVIISGAVLGGIRLGGGRGSVSKALLGTFIVLCINNGMLRMGLELGGSSIVLGTILLFAIIFDIHWNRYRSLLVNGAYVSPTLVFHDHPAGKEQIMKSKACESDSFEKAVEICEGKLDGPDDMVIYNDRIYTSTNNGDIYCISGSNFEQCELYVHIGGRPKGMQVDRDGSLVICVSGMGLYRITKERQVKMLAVQTKRSFSIVDDSRIRMADDVDIAKDGKIYFSDSTIRYESSEWLTDALEGRGNGRLLCYNPTDGVTQTLISNLVFANGVCISHDGMSILVAETWASRISRFWLVGPKKGKLEVLCSNLPGYPANINRSSDGKYWVPLVGLRSPAFDLAMSMPDFRNRMIKRVAIDSWLFPNTNTGCIIKFDGNGIIEKFMLDSPNGKYPQITSVREYKGKLFFSGINNNKIGVMNIDEYASEWSEYSSYWGSSND